MVISVVIPCYRSEKMIANVVNEVKAVFAAQTKYDYQFVLVNDCSPDRTMDEIAKLCREDEKIVGVDLSRNYGQASAKMAGLQYITGDIAVFMDDDGQHPAEGVIQLAEKLQEGYDVVYAHFAKKEHSAFKRLTSSLQKKIAVWAGNSPKGIYGSSFLAYSKFVVEQLKKYHSPFVSAGGYLMRITTRYANVEMPHRQRMEGSSGYTLKKLINLWLNTVTNFSIVPIRAVSVLGVISAAFGLLLGMATVIYKLIDPTIVAGFAAIAALLFCIGGIIMLLLGFLGEYLGRIYMTVSNTPQYTVREAINSPVTDK